MRKFARWIGFATGACVLLSACSHGSTESSAAPTVAAAKSATSSASAQAPTNGPEAAPPPSQTGGFDGARAYDFTAKLVSFGPRPPGSEAIRQTQDYIGAQLQSLGCAVDVDEFHAQTPDGEVPMKNIVAKIAGRGPGIIVLLTHYDTLHLDNFVGADDGGSSSGLLLEMARILCATDRSKQPNSVWIAFLDGEEAQVVENGQPKWASDESDSVYGSRELAARMSVSGDLKRVRAVILADMIGQKGLHIWREEDSTGWLVDLIWQTADRLGYRKVFLPDGTQVSDDHDPFLKRGVPAADVIDLTDYSREGYWHTTQDTMDKLSPRSFAIVGHVILESVAELQQKFH